jgi:hypothetical protein
MRRLLTLPIAILTVVLLVVACTSSDDTADETTTEPPAATVAPPETATTVATTTTTTEATTTVAPPEATELRLTFDGGGCTYEGPTELQPGPVRLFYVNESDELSQMFFSRLDEGYTAQDVIDQLGPQPSSQEAPSWVKAMIPREGSAPGRTLSWRLDLEPGVYTMVCARIQPPEGYEGWFGAGLTVEG